jgi:hypothetical protein
MFGRTTTAALILLASQLVSGCCCYRPFFCCKQRFCGGYAGGCCDSCVSGYSPALGAPIVPAPVYNTVPVQPVPMTGPMANPPIERIPSSGLSAVPANIRR